MKRMFAILAVTLACLLVLAGCGCEHEWADANCVTPKTCNLCQETEGEALGHTWVDADCVNPKTCSVCAETEGEALGHTWVDADCVTPKTCSVCAVTEGEALGHSWLDATTETPKTCSVCAETEGERIVTDERFTTAASSVVFGSWYYDIALTGEEAGLPGLEGELYMRATLTFCPDGEFIITVSPADVDAYLAAMKQYLMDTMYAEFEAQGMDKEAADAAMVTAYGLTMEEYANVALASLDAETLTETLYLVYYVDGDQLYAGESWKAELEPVTFSIDGDSLTLNEDIVYGSDETTVLTRLVEEES